MRSADMTFTVSVRPSEGFYRSSLGNSPVDITIGARLLSASCPSPWFPFSARNRTLPSSDEALFLSASHLENRD